MSKYDTQFKLALVQTYLQGQSGFKVLGRQHGLDPTLLRDWVRRYQHHGIAGLTPRERTQRSHYSAEFKREVLHRMACDGLSAQQAIALFDIRSGVSVISAWQRQYDAGGLDALHPKPRGHLMKKPTSTSPSTANESAELKKLRDENEYLRAEVAYLKKLDALIREKQRAARKKRG